MNISDEERDDLIYTLDYARNAIWEQVQIHRKRIEEDEAKTLGECNLCTSHAETNKFRYQILSKYEVRYEWVRSMQKKLRADRDSGNKDREIWEAMQSNDPQEILKVLP
jgi:hypothetical protein